MLKIPISYIILSIEVSSLERAGQLYTSSLSKNAKQCGSYEDFLPPKKKTKKYNRRRAHFAEDGWEKRSLERGENGQKELKVGKENNGATLPKNACFLEQSLCCTTYYYYLVVI